MNDMLCKLVHLCIVVEIGAKAGYILSISYSIECINKNDQSNYMLGKFYKFLTLDFVPESSLLL